jgi:hypothetical protein
VIKLCKNIFSTALRASLSAEATKNNGTQAINAKGVRLPVNGKDSVNSKPDSRLRMKGLFRSFMV